MQQAASVLVKDAKFIMAVEQKQRYIFSFFVIGDRKTFRDYLDEMRKLGSFLHLFKLLSLSKLSFLIYKLRIIVIWKIK